jgi:hypothetical protein
MKCKRILTREVVNGTMNAPTNTTRELNAQISPLLALPGELRNRIYRYVLLKAEIHLDLHAIHDMTNILRASSQLRAEAKVIFYGENHFIITNAIHQQRHVEAFLNWVGSKNTCKLPCVGLQLNTPPAWTTANRVLADSFESGMSEEQAFDEVVKALGSEDRKIAPHVFSGIITDNLNALTAIAENLVDSGVLVDNIKAQDPGDLALKEKTKDVVDKTSKALARQLTGTFLSVLQARRTQNIETRQSVAGEDE